MSGSSSGESTAGLSLDRSTTDVLLNDIGSLYSAAAISAQPVPVLTPTDRGPSSLERLETFLEGEPISCFIVGGEKRLCFPQVLNAVLRDVPYEEINRACADLNINTPLSSPQQLETLKLTGVLPRNTASCGLITKSDAERLVNYLQQIRRPGQRLLPPEERRDGESAKALGLPVRHDCFGGARGSLFPEHYTSADSPCLECTECGHFFRPDKFVVHSHHQGAERRTCHWGFDSGNWRSYLRLQAEAEEQTEAVDKLAEVKLRFEPSALAARQLLAARLVSASSAAAAAALAPPSIPSAPRLSFKRKAEEVGGSESIGGKTSRVSDLTASLYDPSTLLAYYTSLMRYQSLLQVGGSESIGGKTSRVSDLTASLYDPSTLLAYYTSLMRYQSLLQVGGSESIGGKTSRVSDLTASLYDPSTLLAYYTSLMRYQSLLQAPPPLPGKSGGGLSGGGLSGLLGGLSSGALLGSSGPPPNMVLGAGVPSPATPSKAALAAVSGLLALSATPASSAPETPSVSAPTPAPHVLKPQPVKATALLSPSATLGPSTGDSGKNGAPLKKHLLHAFAEEQKAKEEKSGGSEGLSEGSGARPESSSLSTSSASEGEDPDHVSLDRLLVSICFTPSPRSRRPRKRRAGAPKACPKAPAPAPSPHPSPPPLPLKERTPTMSPLIAYWLASASRLRRGAEGQGREERGLRRPVRRLRRPPRVLIPLHLLCL